MNRLLLAALILGVSIVGLSIGSTVPVVALRLYEAGASNVHIGVMSALPAAGMMLSAFLVDWICQRLSRRHIYLGCFALSALSIAAVEVFASTLYSLALARLVMGLAAGIIIILGESWVNEIAEDSHRGRVVAIYTTCFTIFQLLGPGMVALFGTAGPQVISVVIAGHLLALGMIGFTLPKQVNYHEHSQSKTFSVLGFIQVAPALCMGIIFFSFFDSVILSMFPVYAADHGYAIKFAALMVTVILLGDAALQFPLGWLSDKVARPIIYLGCGVLSLAIGVCLPWLMNYPFLLWRGLHPGDHSDRRRVQGPGPGHGECQRRALMGGRQLAWAAGQRRGDDHQRPRPAVGAVCCGSAVCVVCVAAVQEDGRGESAGLNG